MKSSCGVLVGIVLLHVAAADAVMERGVARHATEACDDSNVSCVFSDGVVDYFVVGGTDSLLICGATQGEIHAAFPNRFPLEISDLSTPQSDRERGQFVGCIEASKSSLALAGAAAHSSDRGGEGSGLFGAGKLALDEDNANGAVKLLLFRGTLLETGVEIYGDESEQCLWAFLIPPDPQTPILVDPAGCSS